MPPRRPSQRANTTPDPRTPNGPGGPLAPGASPHFERGTIVDVDANGHVYRVLLNTGRDLRMGRILQSPGDTALLPLRTPVVVTWAMGLPYIWGVLPLEVAASTSVTPATVTDVPGHGGDDPVLRRPLGATARPPEAPRDLLPGDVALRSPDGAAVAALHGQVAMLRGGPLAKVTAFGDNDAIHILAGLYRLVTWMGESKVTNDDGKTSFVWRGGSDQLTQTGADEQAYTVKLDVGHTGGLIRLEVCSREGQCLFRFQVTPEGACEIFAAGGMSQHGGSSTAQDNPVHFHGARTTRVAGRDETEVRGDHAAVVHGSVSRETAEDLQETVGNDATITVGGDHNALVIGDANAMVGGAAYLRAGGSRTVDVRGAGLYAVQTGTGNVEFTPGGQFWVRVGGRGRINLGTDAAYHAVRFETLQTALEGFKSLIDERLALVASHVHSPPGSTSPTLATLATPTFLDLNPAKVRSTLVD